MKTKEASVLKFLRLEKPTPQSRPKKSLRPMRSMVAVRSLKPKTAVAGVMVKAEELTDSN